MRILIVLRILYRAISNFQLCIVRYPLYYKAFQRLAKLHRRFSTSLLVEVNSLEAGFVYRWEQSTSDPQQTNRALSLAYLIWPSFGTRSATLSTYFPAGGAQRVGTLDRTLVERAAAAIGRAIESRLTALFADPKPYNFYNGLWRIPVTDIDRPGAFNNCLLASTLEFVQLLVEIEQLASLVALLSHFTKTTRSTFSSSESSSRNSDRRYLRDTELPFLVRFLLERSTSLAEAIAGSNETRFRSLADLHSRAEESLSLSELNSMPLQRAELERRLRDTVADVHTAHQLLRPTLSSSGLLSGANGDLLSRVWPAEWLAQQSSRLQQVLCSQVLLLRGVGRLDSSRVDETQLLTPADADGQCVNAQLYSIPKEEEERAKLLAKASALASEVVDERSAIAAHLKPERKRRAAGEKPESTQLLESNDTCSTITKVD